MVRIMVLVVTTTAIVSLLPGPAHAVTFRERLDGGLVSSSFRTFTHNEIHLRLAIVTSPNVIVSGTFRCRTVEVPIPDVREPDVHNQLRRYRRATAFPPRCPGPKGALSNVVLTRRTDPREFGLVDFDADLTSPGTSSLCHIAGTAPFLGNRFLSVTGLYTCTDATGTDTGTFVVQRKCR
jgi:hypothetical protein